MLPGSRCLQAALFVVSGTLHLTKPEPFIAIVPPWLAEPRLIVAVSGVAEIAGGLGILNGSTRPVARWALIALLAAVFPANIYMALMNVQPAGWQIPQPLLWARLPLQPLLMWWILAANKKKGRAERSCGPSRLTI